MINLGVVGLGRWGQRHVESAIASGRFRVARAAVRRPDRVAEFASKRSIIVSDNLEDLLADPNIEAISLATPNSLHAQQILRVAASQKHVLTEKPFTVTKRGAENAVDACVRAGVVVAVGHDNRFYPAILTLKELIGSGALGGIFHVESNISHKGARQAGMSSLASSKTWRHDPREAPVGPMNHLGVHRIDSYVQLFGKIDHVYAQASSGASNRTVADSVALLVRFGTGMTGYIGTSQATMLNSRMQVFGSDGWAEATGPHEFEQYVHSSLNRVSVHRGDSTIETIDFDAMDSVKANFEAFADAIEGKAPYPVPPDELIHVVAIMEAVGTSIETGRAVKVL